jgi:hypothetical protein
MKEKWAGRADYCNKEGREENRKEEEEQPSNLH